MQVSDEGGIEFNVMRADEKSTWNEKWLKYSSDDIFNSLDKIEKPSLKMTDVHSLAFSIVHFYFSIQGAWL